jgi:catechol 2,3-dioxygenase-like lactoylglutathione lyase family enzyme
MRTLHLGLRVADLERSIAFYTSIGYEVLGDVPATDLGTLTMLKLPGTSSWPLSSSTTPPTAGSSPAASATS